MGSSRLIPKGLSSFIFLISVKPNLPSSPGNLKFQYHCCAITSKSTASSGTVTYLFHTIKPGASKAHTPRVVKIVNAHSSFEFSGLYSAFLSLLYLKRQTQNDMNKQIATNTAPVTQKVKIIVSSMPPQFDAISVHHQGVKK